MSAQAATPAAAPAPMDGSAPGRWRYPGAQSFTESPDDRQRFFGREQESEALYLRVLSVPLLLHFGRSGLGKTSLLQAGLFPRLRAKPLLPVMVRLNQAGESLVAAVVRGLRQACAAEGLRAQVPDDAPGLWELLTATDLWRDGLLLMPVLVFDQFEEVFTLRSQAFRQALADELGALLGGKPPARLGPPRPGERLARPAVKVVISLREDYLGALQSFSHALPALFQERLRLEPMQDDAARAAIEGPAGLATDAAGRPYTVPPFGFAPESLDAMVRYLRGSSGVIEPFQLQLLCRHAEDLAAAHQAPDNAGPLLLRPADFAGADDFDAVLRGFYRRCIDALPRGERAAAQRLCEEGLLDAEGHRLMLDVGQVRSDFRVSDASLAQLEQARLLRSERRLDSAFYEISHDRLAVSISATRRFRLPARLRHALYAAVVVVPLVVVLVVLWALQVGHERDRADQARNRAEGLVSFLLGEGFLGQVRDAGLSEQLQQVNAQTRRALEGEGRGINQGLALRNAGDIERQRGHSAEALALYRQAQAHFTAPALPASGPAASAMPALPGAGGLEGVREAARTHSRLGDLMADQGQVPQALAHHRQAAELWLQVDRSGSAQVADCTAWAASLLQAATLQQRVGDTQSALSLEQQVLAKALHVLLGPDGGPPACQTSAKAGLLARAQPDPDPQALALVGQAALLHGALRGNEEDFEGALLLARQVRWLQPLSTTARKDVLVALVQQASQRAWADPAATALIYRSGLVELDELLRLDAGNQPWRRERAAVQLLLASLLANCARAPAPNCPPAVERRHAGDLALEALATLRELARLDPANQAWRADLAWALQVYAETLQDHDDEGLRAYDEARALQLPLATPDNDEARLTLSRLLVRRAAAVARMGNERRAVDGYREAVALLQSLRERRPASAVLMTDLRDAWHGLASRLRAVGDAAGADDALRHAALLDDEQRASQGRQAAADQALVASDGLSLRQRLQQQLELGDASQLADVVLQASAAVQRWRQFIVRRPTDAAGWAWLSECNHLLAQALDKSLGPGLQDRQRRLVPAIAALQAADVASHLAERQAPALRTLTQDRLAEARRGLIGLLIDDRRSEEALQIVRTMVSDAEVVLGGPMTPGAAPAARVDDQLRQLASLVQAQFVLGLLRRDKKLEGWEEAWRSGLLQVQRALLLRPDDLPMQMELGRLHRFLGEELRLDGQAIKSRADLLAARTAYQRARSRALRLTDAVAREQTLADIDPVLASLDKSLGG